MVSSYRFIIAISFFIGFFLLPWWLIVPLLIGAVIKWSDHYELFFISFLFDSVAGSAGGDTITRLPLTLSLLILAIVLVVIKPYLRTNT